MQFINQHSFLLAAAAGLLVLAGILFHDGIRPSDWLALAALVLGLLFAYWLFRPSASSAADANNLTAQLHSGKPVLIEFQSPY